MLIIKTPIHTMSEPPIPMKKPPKRPPISWITSHKRGNAKARINSAMNTKAMNFSTFPIILCFKSWDKITTSLSHFPAQACFFIEYFQVRVLKEEKSIALLNSLESLSMLFNSRQSYENDSTYFLAEKSESALYVTSSLMNDS